MAAVSEHEIQPGLVVFLDPQILRSLGDSLTNATIINGVDRAVQGAHYFLVYEVSDTTASVVALYSEKAQGREQFDEALKSGHADKWIGLSTYFFRWVQYWIPLRSIALASVDDESPSTNRRRYAVSSPSALDRIRGFAETNRNSPRPL
jgi:hypothetical protein